MASRSTPPKILPMFEELARRDTVIWMHPAPGAEITDYLSEPKSRFEIWWAFAWLYETSAAVASPVFSCIFDRQPDLNFGRCVKARSALASGVRKNI